MRKILLCSVAITALWTVAGSARADDNMSKLSAMQATGTAMAAFAPVPQTGANADQLRKNLEQIKLFQLGTV